MSNIVSTPNYSLPFSLIFFKNCINICEYVFLYIFILGPYVSMLCLSIHFGTKFGSLG